MAFSRRTLLSPTFLHRNECISTSVVVIVLLAYRITNSKKRIYGFDIVKRAARGALCFIVYSPKRMLGYTRAAVAGLSQYSLLEYIRNVLNPIYEWGWYRSPNYSTYPTKEAEQRYWDSARLFRRQLQSSDARFCLPSSSHKSLSRDSYEDRFPVISSYQPALPPLRNSYDLYAMKKPRKSFDRSVGGEYHLPTKAFCKWYRMTHPDQVRFFNFNLAQSNHDLYEDSL